MFSHEPAAKALSTCCRWAALVSAAAVLLTAGLAPAETRVVSQVWELEHWLVNCQPWDEIVMNPGVYETTKCLYFSGAHAVGVTLRGATGNAGDVIIRGPGMNDPNGSHYEGFQFNTSDMTLRDLTIEEFYHHAVHFQGVGDRCVVDNVILRNTGCQYIKGARFNDDGIIRNCLLEQTTDRLNGLPGRSDDYTGGIDLHGARRFHIHDNLIKDIKPLGDTGDGAIFLWNESQDCIIERNVVIGCSEGIALGNPSDQGVWQVQNSIVRNNFVLAKPNDDIGIELCYTLNCKVYNNTIYRTGAPGSADWDRTIQVFDNATYPTTNLDIKNNIIRGGVKDKSSGDWSDAAVAAMGNLVYSQVPIPPEWFVDPDNLNLHLTEAAIAAINQAVALGDVPYDIDGGPRPAGGAYDYGADEFASPMGDATYDGIVDGADYTAWADHYQQSGGWGEGDFTGDGYVDGADYTAWADHYGYGVGAAAVPEPACLLLVTLGGAALLARRKR